MLADLLGDFEFLRRLRSLALLFVHAEIAHFLLVLFSVWSFLKIFWQHTFRAAAKMRAARFAVHAGDTRTVIAGKLLE